MIAEVMAFFVSFVMGFATNNALSQAQAHSHAAARARLQAQQAQTQALIENEGGASF